MSANQFYEECLYLNLYIIIDAINRSSNKSNPYSPRIIITEAKIMKNLLIKKDNNTKTRLLYFIFDRLSDNCIFFTNAFLVL